MSPNDRPDTDFLISMVDQAAGRSARGNSARDRAASCAQLPVRARLAVRSVARGLPSPMEDRGGYRVDTNSDSERQRWVFAEVTGGLSALARSIHAPGYLIKACATPEQLQAALPPGWQVHLPAYFMLGPSVHPAPQRPAGYRVNVVRDGPVSLARVVTEAGELVATGYAAETGEAFVYDRIAIDPRHRRRGLGRLVMAMLSGARRVDDVAELLVATEEGRALYQSLGWTTLSVYSTASRCG